MTKLKPVWRMNTGEKPDDFNGNYIYAFGRLDCFTKPYEWQASWTWRIQGRDFDYAAYETNRAKAAKYERVECDECNGYGEIIHEYRGLTREHQAIIIIMCQECNGTGRMARRITC